MQMRRDDVTFSSVPVTEGKKIPMRTTKEVVMSVRMSPFFRSPGSSVPIRLPSSVYCLHALSTVADKSQILNTLKHIENSFSE